MNTITRTEQTVALDSYDPLIIVDPEPTITSDTSVNVSVTTEGGLHIHGPGCGHGEHAHDRAAPVPAKYSNPKMIPRLDVAATFATNTGPKWAKTSDRVMNQLREFSASIPQGEVGVFFANVYLYQWLLACVDFRKQLVPSKAQQVEESAIFGMWGPKVIIMCDANLKERAMDKAFYFCQEVVLPVKSDTELVATALDAAGNATEETQVVADANANA